jgi:tetraacyldisaccharide 4'-kinase
MIVKPEDPSPLVQKIGDEPWMIRSKNPGLAMAIHPRRAELAKKSWKQLGEPKIVLLDDGFQHWRAMRDFDVVVIDASEALPIRGSIGRFRESLSALRRADLVVLTRANECAPEQLAKWRELVLSIRKKAFDGNSWKRNKYKIPAFQILNCGYEFAAFREGESGKVVSAGEITKALLLSGIAKPESFARLVREQGIVPSREIFLADHADLSIELKVRLAKEKPLVLVTEKDWARWRAFFVAANIPAIYADVSLRFSPSSQKQLDTILQEMLLCITSA